VKFSKYLALMVVRETELVQWRRMAVNLQAAVVELVEFKL